MSKIDPKKWGKASLTAKSYILQAAEATSREAKLHVWECKKRGIQVGSLQHDGILCYVRKEEEAEAERAMSEAASAACGYPVKVEAKTVGIAPMRVD